VKFYGYCRDLEIAIMSDGKQLQGAADNKRIPRKNLKRLFFFLWHRFHFFLGGLHPFQFFLDEASISIDILI